MKQLALTALVVLALPLVRAEALECLKAKHPFEQAVCADRALSQAYSEMNSTYAFLLARCPDVAAHARLRATQRRWLARVRRAYGKGGPKAENLLQVRYGERNAALERLVAQCAQAGSGPVTATVQIMTDRNGLELPFVETSPPVPGWRINRRVIGQTADAAALFDASAFKIYLDRHPLEDAATQSQKVSVVRNDGRLLVLQKDGKICSGDCSGYSVQWFFDLSTGRQVQTADVFSKDDTAAFAQKLKESRIARAKSIFAGLKGVEGKDVDQYGSCLDHWENETPELWPMHLLADGRWAFQPPRCGDYRDGPAALRTPVDYLASLDEIRPYLSAYGKSLLLNEGDVRAPYAPTSLVCGNRRGLPVRRDNRAPAPGMQAAAGPHHFLLLTRDGKLWGWGEGQEGELGPVKSLHMVPVYLGDDYAETGGGEYFSAALKRDGTLWTWGNNYLNRLGDATVESSTQPVRIGDHFVSLKVESDGGMALKDDGTVWAWGGKWKTPQQLMAGVAQIEYGPAGERLMLKKDGTVWALGGQSFTFQKPYDDTRPRLVGGGFRRLAVRHGDLAYKADGALWAWNALLATTSYAPPQDSFELPADVGRGFVQVTVGEARSPYLAALKADGSLWLAKVHETQTQLEPLGCGYAQVTAGGQYLLALKQDGNLELSDNWEYTPTTGEIFPQDIFLPKASAQKTPSAPKQHTQRKRHALKETHAPVRPAELAPLPGYAHRLVLGRGFTRLFQVRNLWTTSEAGVVALRKDGTVWVFDPPRPPTQEDPRNWLRQVPFPKEANIGD